MPRIIIGNPLGTAGEGMAQGADLVRREREHQARLKAFEADLEQASLRTDMAKRAEQMQIEDRARAQQQDQAFQQFVGGMEGLSPDQRERASRMDPKNLPLFVQMNEAERERAKKDEHMRMLEVESNLAQTDPMFPVDAQRASAIMAEYGDNPEQARNMLKAERGRARHVAVQGAQREFARGEMINIMSSFPEAFRPPPAGASKSAEQERIDDLLDELNDDPMEPDKGSADYLGALAELRVLSDPSLKGAYRRIQALYQADFSSALNATLEGMNMGPTLQQSETARGPAQPKATLGPDPVMDAADVIGADPNQAMTPGYNDPGDAPDMASLPEGTRAKMLGEETAQKDVKPLEERKVVMDKRKGDAAMSDLQTYLASRRGDGDPLTEEMVRTTQRRERAQGREVSRETIEAMYNGTWTPESAPAAKPITAPEPEAERAPALRAARKLFVGGETDIEKIRAAVKEETGVELSEQALLRVQREAKRSKK